LILSPRARPARLGALAAALAATLYLLPAEASLGDLLRAVYLHGALLRAGEAAFAGGGIAGLLYLLSRRDAAVRWSWSFQKTATLVWLASFAVSSYVTVAAWGSINWAEPRFLASGQILAAAGLAVGLGILLERPWLRAAVGIALAGFVAVQLTTAGLMLHPENPIGASTSAELRIFYLAALALAVAATLEIVAWMARDREQAGRAPAPPGPGVDATL
jgi:hypothetical protein